MKITTYDMATGEVVVRDLTPEELADLAAATATPPGVPTLSREAFCVALIGAGILTEEEASEAALGAWPAKFDPALNGRTLIEQLEAKNLWQRIKIVPRDASLFLDILQFYKTVQNLTDAQAEELADTIFAGAA